ncbi:MULTISPECIES: helix-turn-helix domain-containing protein [unclassified Sedimentibacter]|uniref:helix-turn-helix domain-containing protein n=1 Tax=unclassified Sedimentibacter TaxID=2649220 RepID=UPI0027E0C356|nr:helix-turn-helix domain-containing protein [Sedimentibacter sp. MB35-C1]WMJ76898.1 helix-turn-helix domain-containing protein [Sedimentibacter sp. MB35-C1]
MENVGYITAKEVAEKWNISLRRVQKLCEQGRIPGTKKFGRAWMIAADAEKPVDPRRKKKRIQDGMSSEPSDLERLIDATCVPMPIHNPDAILNIVKEEQHQLQYESELAYLRGDFEQTIRCCQRAEGNEAAKLRSSLIAVAAFISLGNYHAYTEIESYLKRCIKTNRGSDIVAIAELALASVAVSATLPNMVPDWLKEGDFSDRSVLKKPYTSYLQARYFFCVGRYEAMLNVAQTALTLSASEQEITFADIYLRVTCAIACYHLEREEEARRWLLEVMRICLPHGFITPFAEVITQLGGLIEQCLKQEFPDYYDAIISQYNRTAKNWITFHNKFAQDNITLVLSLREYHIAMLVARHVPYAKIAEKHYISVGRLKNIMMEIYDKLNISGRDELAAYIMEIKR